MRASYPCGCTLRIARRLLLDARLAQSAERKALNLVVVGSSPTVGVYLRNMSDYASIEYMAGATYAA